MRLVTFVALILLAGCSSTVTTTPENAAQQTGKLANFKPAATFTVRWHRNIGNLGSALNYSTAPLGIPAETRWRMNPDLGDMGNSTLNPVLTPDAVYAANAEGKIVRFERSSGVQVWRVDTGFIITGGIGLGDGQLFVGGEKGEVAAYDETGAMRWRSLVSSEVLGAPQFANGIVVVRSVDGRIAGLDAADGKRKWLYERMMPALVVRAPAAMLIRNGTIFVGFAGGKLAAIDLSSGIVKWEATLSEPGGTTELERISDITSTPQTDGRVVCAVSFQGRIGCFDAARGTQLWTKPFSSDKGMALEGQYLYVADAEGVVQALDKDSGSSIWKNERLAKRQTAAPIVFGKYLIMGDHDGYLYAIRRDDGSLAARIATDGSAIRLPPVKMDDEVLVETYDGGLYAVALH